MLETSSKHFRELFLRHYKNSIWPVLEQVSVPFVMVIGIPVFMKYLGAEQYGIWILINSVTSFVGVFNFGIGPSIIKFVSKYRALNNFEKIKNVINNVMLLSLAIFVFIMLIGVGILAYLKNHNFFNISAAYYPVFLFSIFMGFLIVGLRMMEQHLFSILKAYERFDISSQIAIVTRNIPIIVNVVLAYKGFGLKVIFISTLLVTLVGVIFEYFYINFRFINVNIFSGFNIGVLKEIGGFSLLAWVQSISGLFSNQLDKLIFSKLAGVANLPYYFIGINVMFFIHGIFAAACGFLFPLISKKFELERNISGVYRKAQTFVVGSGVLFILLIFLSRTFLFKFWLGEATYIQAIKYIEIFLIAEVFMLLTIIPYYTFLGTGYVYFNVSYLSLLLILQILFMFVFYNVYGMLGLAWGKALAIAISSVFATFMVRLKFNIGKIQG